MAMSILEGMGSDTIWIVVLGFIFSFVLSIALGANDVANSFGTSVGAKVLTLLQACICAAIFETLGALIIGSRVSETIRKGLFDPTIYTGNEELLMVGNLCALGASCIWLFIATWLKLPVSASHCVVGATLGYHMVIFADVGVDWYVVVKIAMSWVISPVLSGLISGFIFLIIHFTVLRKDDPLTPGLISQPIWYLVVMVINLFAILNGSTYIPEYMRVWVSIVTAFGVGAVTAVIVNILIVPRTRRKILEARHERKQIDIEHNKGLDSKETAIPMATLNEVEIAKLADDPHGVIVPGTTNQEARHERKQIDIKHNKGLDSKETAIPIAPLNEVEIAKLADDPHGVIVPGTTNQENHSQLNSNKDMPTDSVSLQGTVVSNQPLKSKHSEEWQNVKDPPEVFTICSPLQVLSASFAAFSHGGNDVSNAIGPLVSLWYIYQTGLVSQDAKTDYWILLYGGAGISIGLFTLGKRVIETVGENLTPMTPSNGFSIELGSATTVLLASNLGIPVSTTHCKVGSVCAVGWLRNRSAVDWRLFSGIFVAWVVTLPASIGLSAALMGLLQHTVPSLCSCMPFEGFTTGFPNMTYTVAY